MKFSVFLAECLTGQFTHSTKTPFPFGSIYHAQTWFAKLAAAGQCMHIHNAALSWLVLPGLTVFFTTWTVFVLKLTFWCLLIIKCDLWSHRPLKNSYIIKHDWLTIFLFQYLQSFHLATAMSEPCKQTGWVLVSVNATFGKDNANLALRWRTNSWWWNISNKENRFC